jgi:hypothetical protein
MKLKITVVEVAELEHQRSYGTLERYEQVVEVNEPNVVIDRVIRAVNNIPALP